MSVYHLVDVVVTLDGSVPIKYGLLLNTDDNYKKLKKQLAKFCCLTPAQLLMAELIGASIKVNDLINLLTYERYTGFVRLLEIQDLY